MKQPTGVSEQRDDKMKAMQVMISTLNVVNNRLSVLSNHRKDSKISNPKPTPVRKLPFAVTGK